VKEQIMRGRIGGVVCATALVLWPAGLALWAAGRGSNGQSDPGGPTVEVQQKLPESLTPGQPAAMDILVRNRGGERVENVVLSATLPDGWRVLDAESSEEREPGPVRRSLGTLEAGAERTVHLRVATTADALTTGRLRSAVKVTYQMSVENTAVAVVQRPALTMRISTPETANVGEATPVAIVIDNKGNAAAEGVVLQTVLPAGLSHPGGNDLETEVGTIKPGETKQITLSVTPMQAGNYRHTVRLVMNGQTAAEQESRIVAQDLKMTLTANGPRLLYTDWTGSFEITVRNDDTAAFEHVVVAVGLPAGLSAVRSSDNGAYDSQDRSVKWQVPVMKPGESRTFVWSGAAGKLGDQECRITAIAGTRGRKTTTWRTTVKPAETSLEPTAAPPQTPSNPAMPSTPARPGAVEVKWHPADDAPGSSAIKSETREPLPVAVGWNGRSPN
jgi:uncharacterized repeat protein (TIGR01451 family)